MQPQILIVDDEPELRTILIEHLKDKLKATWIEANSGYEALELLKNSSCSLVISDVNMANGTGVWLHQKMKNEGITIPLLFFTSEAFGVKNKPMLDNILKGIVFKFDYEGLVRRISIELSAAF